MIGIILVTFVWFVLALIVGATRLLATIPPPFPQAVLFFLVILLLVLFWKINVFRNWSLNVGIRILLLVHLTRFVGIYFLILYSSGLLPYDFAVPGGWGDILVAITALIVVIFSPIKGLVGWTVYLIWNLFGFIDILFVVQTAGRLAMADPVSMVSLTKLPLSLLPTFVVPIIIYIHIVIFIRLWFSWSKRYTSI
jgi:hypothetical protein